MVEVVTEFVHLAPYAVGMAVFNVYAGFYASVFQNLAYLSAEHFEAFGLSAAVAFDESVELFIFVGTAEAEAQVLEFGLHMVEAETVGQRCVEVVGLTGYLHLLVGPHRGERAHVVQTVGKFHQYGADVVLDGVEHLLEVVELTRHLVLVFLLLCHHTHQEGHVIAEALAYVVDGIVGIFHYIVQEGCDHRIGAERKLLSRNQCHGYRVQYVWLARLAFLWGMSLACEGKGIAYALHVLRRCLAFHGGEYLAGALVDNLVVVRVFHLA